MAHVTISGKIHDLETGESIPGVAVMVKGTTRGDAANVEGFFSIPNLEAGANTLIFSALGYERKEMMIELADGESINILTDMKPMALKMGEVEIVTEYENEDPKFAPEVARIRVSAKQLSKVPQVAEADLFRALQIMPGVLPSSDFSADLNIWGGSADQNLILLNGINVYKPSHLGGFFSIFNMDAIKDVKLIKGGFGAKYGGRLSAVVDISDREGNRNETHGKVGVSFLSSQAMFEGPLPKGSWMVAGRRTYVDGATKLLKDWKVVSDDFPYYFYDFNAKVTRDFENGDRLTPSVYYGDDIFKITSSSNDRIRLNWGNRTYSLPYVHIFSPKLYSRHTLAGSHFNARQRFETTDAWFEWENEMRDFTAKSEFTWYPNARNTIEFGAQSKYIDASLLVQDQNRVYLDANPDGNLASVYVSDNYRVTEKFTVTPGLRYEYFSLSDQHEPQPRLGWRYDLNDHSTLSAAWGMYTQYQQLVSFGSGFVSIFDSYVPLDESFEPNRGYQYALSYVNERIGPFRFTWDIYYKKFRNVIEFEIRQEDDGDSELNDMFMTGDGYAYGIDALLEGTWGSYDVFIGYALGQSRRSFSKIDSGLVYPTHFDKLHNSNVTLSRKIRKRAKLEVRCSYSSGKPQDRPVAAYSPGLDLPGHFFERGRKNAYRVPDYFRLDVAYRLRYDFKRWSFSPYIEFINLTGRKNRLAEQISVETNPPTTDWINQLPFIPSIGFTAEF
ncbi:TonB-dependent receptor [bacterium]|nr:TonB-dependent receptor [bacterium]MBU1636855.1 TonB-dependent receptor [bacterium]